MSSCWAILAGAYPPQPGGVSDHTRLVARGLAAAGDRVEVFAAAAAPAPPADVGVRVHVMQGGFDDLGALGALDDALHRLPDQRQLLVQYTPRAFGRWGVNPLLPLWLLSRREPVTVMFHEVMHPVHRAQPLRHNLLGAAQRVTAALLARAATRALVSTPRWGQILRELGAVCPVAWAPVPSNLPTRADPARVARARAALVPPDQLLVGHFGTYGPLLAPLLEPLIVGVLRLEVRLRFLLLGRGARAFGERVIAHHPGAAGRIIASRPLEEQALAEHLCACDLLVQPYPDGITTRRSSLMAGLALGVPIVSNLGALSEPLWRGSGAVAVARDAEPSSMIEPVQSLLGDPRRRRARGLRGRRLYAARFDLERTIQLLRG